MCGVLFSVVTATVVSIAVMENKAVCSWRAIEPLSKAACFCVRCSDAKCVQKKKKTLKKSIEKISARRGARKQLAETREKKRK